MQDTSLWSAAADTMRAPASADATCRRIAWRPRPIAVPASVGSDPYRANSGDAIAAGVLLGARVVALSCGMSAKTA